MPPSQYDRVKGGKFLSNGRALLHTGVSMQDIYYHLHLHFRMSGQRIIEVDVSGGYVITDGERIDPFDVVDSLHGTGDKILIHDMDGRRRNKHQLDMIQDLSAEITVWYEGGFRRADNLIDPIVAGAEEIVVGRGHFTMAEFETAIRITDSVVIDADFEHTDGVKDAGFSEQSLFRMRDLFNMGYSGFILSPDKIEGLSEFIGKADMNLWIRTGESIDSLSQLSREFPALMTKVQGRIASISELEDKDG